MELKNEITEANWGKRSKAKNVFVTDAEIPFVIGSWSQPALPEAFFSLVLA